MATANNSAFSIKIYFPDGDSDGFRTITKDQWSGKGIVCPQSLFPERKKEPEFKKPGVYVLVGTCDETGKIKIYIGEGDPVLDRLNDHHVKKDYWTKVIFFICPDNRLNKAHIQYLESRLIAFAREAKQCTLENKNEPNLPSLSQEDSITAESFLQEMLHCFAAVGIKFFGESDMSNAPKAKLPKRNNLFHIKAKGIEATGYWAEDAFVVYEGSQVVIEETKSLQEHYSYVVRIRERLIDEGILKENTEKGIFVFTQNCPFDSANTASYVVLGVSGDGHEQWKNDNGITLKEIRQREAKD